ncbi:EKC/KEOPS complex subunit Tp53rkb-like [Babylonia areolata]|uniref:EKC/KEOPS complex subunit Tp53rkb-like n=1 Tax=Babylonia areolata TaxID=304850 RepID=UPI003FD5810D
MDAGDTCNKKAVKIMDRVFLKQGAEAKLQKCTFYGKPCLVKERFQKKYRHPVLDRSLTTQRLKSEVRAMLRCRTNGIRTPAVYMVDMESSTIYMEYVEPSVTVREFIANIQQSQLGEEPLLKLAGKIGQVIGTAHRCNIIHGDLTSSNMLLAPRLQPDSARQTSAGDMLNTDITDLDVVLIDFGLTSLEGTAEDKGVDLYVLERALLSTHPNTQHVFEAILAAYRQHNRSGAAEVIRKLDEVRLRGRKRTMVG